MAYYFDILVDDEIVKLKLTPKCVYEEYYIDLSIDGELVHQKIELEDVYSICSRCGEKFPSFRNYYFEAESIRNISNFGKKQIFCPGCEEDKRLYTKLNEKVKFQAALLKVEHGIDLPPETVRNMYLRRIKPHHIPK